MLHGAVASINPPQGGWAAGDVLVPLVGPSAMCPVMRVAGTGFPATSPSVTKGRHSRNLHAAGDFTGRFCFVGEDSIVTWREIQ